MSFEVKGNQNNATGIWLLSSGLSIGILLVLFLFSVIIYEGLLFFWPRDVAVITYVEDGNQKKIAGELIKEQLQKNTETPTLEVQLYIAGKDVNGASFRFFDKDDIKVTKYPKNILKVERMEYGFVFANAVSLTLKDEIFKPENTLFDDKLKFFEAESHRLRNKLEDLQKSTMGEVNEKLHLLKLEKNPADKTKIEDLEKQYLTLEKEADKIKKELTLSFLTLKTITGETLTVDSENYVRSFYPNQLGTAGKISKFLKNSWNFIMEYPREANVEGGIFPIIFGTFTLTLIMCLLVTPFGVLAAIYLHEYAKQGPFVRIVRICINNLAGVPSIVFGVFGLGFFVYFIGGGIDKFFFSKWLPEPTFGTGGILWASLTLALMTVPVIIVSTEESLSAVPRGIREGALALGSSKWQMIQKIILPSSIPGILTGMIIAMARGAGEVAPLMLVGVVKLAPELPMNLAYPFLHLDSKFMHLGFHIYDLGFQSPDSEAAKPMVFATTLLLIALVIVMNLTAIIIREKIRKRTVKATF